MSRLTLFITTLVGITVGDLMAFVLAYPIVQEYNLDTFWFVFGGFIIAQGAFLLWLYLDMTKEARNETSNS